MLKSDQQEKKEIYYFAYGSNMDPDQIRDRIGELPPAFSAILNGYRLVFNKQATKKPEIGYANIEKDSTSCVEGIVYSISSRQLQLLDNYEGGSNNYRQIIVIVNDRKNNQYSAIAYQGVENKIKPNLKPSKAYLNHLLKGRLYLSQEYYDKLQQQETL